MIQMVLVRFLVVLVVSLVSLRQKRAFLLSFGSLVYTGEVARGLRVVASLGGRLLHSLAVVFRGFLRRKSNPLAEKQDLTGSSRVVQLVNRVCFFFPLSKKQTPDVRLDFVHRGNRLRFRDPSSFLLRPEDSDMDFVFVCGV